MSKKANLNNLLSPKTWECLSKIDFMTKKYMIHIERVTYDNSVPFIVPLHSHPFYEFHYCPEGRGSVTIDNTTYEVSPGTFFITGPYVFHSEVSDDKEPLREFTFMAYIEPLSTRKSYENNFLYADFDNVLETIVNNKAYFGKDKFNAYEGLMNIHKTMISSGDSMNITQWWLYIMQTFISTAKNIEPIPKTLTNTFNNNPDSSRLTILDKIFRTYTRVTQEEAAKELSVSVRQLNRIVTKHFGMTYKQKFMQSRMDIALSLLKSSDDSIEEIAQRLDFHSPQYFSKVFKKYHGFSPFSIKKH